MRSLLAVLGLITLTPCLGPACGTSDKLSDAATTSSGSGSSGAGGGTGGSMGFGPCDQICAHIADIQCQAWPSCLSDCNSKFHAPPDCEDEMQALLECWAANLSDLTCTDLQVLPPQACQPLEDAYGECFKGATADGGIDTSCICSAGVGSSADDSCARRTTCNNNEYRAVCKSQSPGMPWTCSCYNATTLIGTCSEPEAMDPHCDNTQGCCAAFYCASMGG
jgi:hypothetical protein